MTIPAVFKFVNWITGTPVPIDDAVNSALTATVDPTLLATFTALVNSVVVIPPSPLSPVFGGRLTLTSLTPVLSTSVSGATIIYYTPYIHNKFTYYNGTSLQISTFSELSLTLDNNAAHTGYHAANTIFDLFIDYNNGSPRLVTSPAWSNNGAGTSARGYTIDRTVANILTNAASMQVRYGTGVNDFTTIAAGLLTYVGTFRTIGTDGQVSMFRGGPAAGGNAGLLYLWNMYNRVLSGGEVTDTTVNWTYSSGTARAADGSNGNRVSFVTGFAEDYGIAEWDVGGSVAGGGVFAVGVLLNGTNGFSTRARSASATVAEMPVLYFMAPQLGYNFVQATEAGDGANTSTFNPLGTAYTRFISMG